MFIYDRYCSCWIICTVNIYPTWKSLLNFVYVIFWYKEVSFNHYMIIIMMSFINLSCGLCFFFVMMGLRNPSQLLYHEDRFQYFLQKISKYLFFNIQSLNQYGINFLFGMKQEFHHFTYVIESIVSAVFVYLISL